jgi:hypothetical protein
LIVLGKEELVEILPLPVCSGPIAAGSKNVRQMAYILTWRG